MGDCLHTRLHTTNLKTGPPCSPTQNLMMRPGRNEIEKMPPDDGHCYTVLPTGRITRSSDLDRLNSARSRRPQHHTKYLSNKLHTPITSSLLVLLARGRARQVASLTSHTLVSRGQLRLPFQELPSQLILQGASAAEHRCDETCILFVWI